MLLSAVVHEVLGSVVLKLISVKCLCVLLHMFPYKCVMLWHICRSSTTV